MKTIDLNDVRERVLKIEKQLNSAFIDRELAIRVLVLAELSRTNYALFGNPGTAKTKLVSLFVTHVAGGSYFGPLCGSFTTEDKLFGPLDIEAFKRGEYKRVIKGRMAACTHVVLDEGFKSNEGTLNSTLSAINEHLYEGEPIPLRVCGLTSNWPELRSRTENVSALYDRFLLRVEVSDVTGTANEVALLEAAEKIESYAPATTITVEEVDAVAAHIKTLAISRGVREALVDARHRLAKEKIHSTPRRLAQLQVVLRASAWLNGRAEVTLDDFDAVAHGLWHDRDQIKPVHAVIGALDNDAVAEAIREIDQAMADYARLTGMQPGRRMDEAPKVIRRMKEAAVAVKKTLQTRALTTRSKSKIAKSMDGLRAKFDELSKQVDNLATPLDRDQA